MNSLRELQESCYQAFACGDTAALLPAVRGNGTAPEKRIEIYRNNNREIFRKSLLASFPVIERLVGEPCFAGLARGYTRKHPSRSGDLQRFGANFAAFLDGVYADSRFCYLSDVARLEWALEEVHVEPDEPPLEFAELSGFSPREHSDFVFTFRKAVRLVGSRFPILSIWKANRPGNDSRVDLDQGGENVAVFRRRDDLLMRPLDGDAFALALELARGVRLADAWESDRAAPDLAAALQAIMSFGLLAEVSLADPPSAIT